MTAGVVAREDSNRDVSRVREMLAPNVGLVNHVEHILTVNTYKIEEYMIMR
jgi:hypothetical protein